MPFLIRLAYDMEAILAPDHARGCWPLIHNVPTGILNSSATSLPFGTSAWIKQQAKKLDFDLAIHPRGRPKRPANREECHKFSDLFFFFGMAPHVNIMYYLHAEFVPMSQIEQKEGLL